MALRLSQSFSLAAFVVDFLRLCQILLNTSLKRLAPPSRPACMAEIPVKCIRVLINRVRPLPRETIPRWIFIYTNNDHDYNTAVTNTVWTARQSLQRDFPYPIPDLPPCCRIDGARHTTSEN